MASSSFAYVIPADPDNGLLTQPLPVCNAIPAGLALDIGHPTLDHLRFVFTFAANSTGVSLDDSACFSSKEKVSQRDHIHS
jgi:hypothetical protein